jgi:hypothetical protein
MPIFMIFCLSNLEIREDRGGSQTLPGARPGGHGRFGDCQDGPHAIRVADVE